MVDVKIVESVCLECSTHLDSPEHDAYWAYVRQIIVKRGGLGKETWTAKEIRKADRLWADYIQVVLDNTKPCIDLDGVVICLDCLSEAKDKLTAYVEAKKEMIDVP